MLIAKIKNGAVVEIAEHRALFPNTSFPVTGPSAEWLAEHSCMTVTLFKAHDRATQKLVTVDPYIENGQVFTVEVQDKTQAELDAEQAAADAASKAGNEARAKRELLDSDWSELPTVRDVSVDPHLTNAADFDAYRVALRAIVVNPPAVAVWPTKPDAVWSTAQPLEGSISLQSYTAGDAIIAP